MENNKLKEAMEEKVKIYEAPEFLADSNTYYKGIDKPSLEEAIEVLCNALREDTSEGSYYYSWQANIAMAFYDAVQEDLVDGEEGSINDKKLVEYSNEAAKNFLNLLISK